MDEHRRGAPDSAQLGRRPVPRRERPAHPPVAAALLMLGIVLFLVVVSAMAVR